VQERYAMPLQFEPAERFDLLYPPKKVSTHRLGFDKSSNWQMVPKGGSRHLIIRNAANIAFEASPAAKVNLHPSVQAPDPRNVHIWVDGISEGSCILKGKDRQGTTVGLINLDVVVPRAVKTAFYRLSDAHMSASKNLDDDTVRWLVERVRDIVFDQTNCKIEAVPTAGGALLRDFPVTGKALSVPKTSPLAPDEIDLDQTKPVNVSEELSINLATGASYHVFFAWGLVGANGVTKGVKSLILDSLDPLHMPVTLSHEFVHFLSSQPGLDVLNGGGHDSLNDDLSLTGARMESTSAKFGRTSSFA
jgi:hypothetical protein